MPPVEQNGRLGELKDRLVAEIRDLKESVIRLDDKLNQIREDMHKRHYEQEHAILSLKLKVALIGAGSGLSVAGAVELVTRLMGT